jgi:hypothetical protein
VNTGDSRLRCPEKAWRPLPGFLGTPFQKNGGQVGTTEASNVVASHAGSHTWPMLSPIQDLSVTSPYLPPVQGEVFSLLGCRQVL